MAKKSKRNISDYLKRTNVKRFLIFIVISFVFLLISKFSNDYKQTIILKPILENVDDEIVLSETEENTIQVKVEAKGFVLVPFIFDNIKELNIDVKQHTKVKDSTFVFDIAEHRSLIDGVLGNSYKILSIRPQLIEIPFSKLASKKVPVVFNKSINYVSGFDIDGEFVLNRDSVKLVGPASTLKEIKQVHTDTLKLKDVKEDIEQSVKLNISKFEDVDVFPKNVQVSATVDRFTEGTVEVPISIVNQPSGVDINYFPKTVPVAYYVALEKYKTIKPTDFIVECDYSKVKEGQTFLIPEVTKHPKSVHRVNVKSNRIDFIKL